ncbi:neutral/alkaline non-lysosomal ceramidase N-terminal domain-containing protein [Paenibacillus sp. HJGM_3]|uniref:neutral/alkaline non-lysosomal ceramidase N-terminal domain-containing protein n=1 Tax=Paenibacillus sp. HJGM_3 TaxID=3379816 RepID=UPI003859E65F
MKFGVGKDLITPDVLTSMGGYSSFHGKHFLGIHDHLYVKALLLDDGKERLMFISIDLLFHDYALTETVKQYALEKHGISRDCLFLSYTHTHGGPAIRGYGDPGQYSETYEQFLLARIKSCMDRTLLNQYEGSMEYGSIEGDWNINRRKPVDGRIELAPNPEGAKDNTLHMLKLVDRNGHIKAVTIFYACHPVTVRDTLYLSGDFPGRICQLLEAECFGATAIFLQGAGGNARPKITASGNEFLTKTYEEVNEMSVAIVERIKRTLFKAGAFTKIEADFVARQFEIPLSLDPFPKQRFAEAASDKREPIGTRRVAEGVYARYEQMPDEIRLPGGFARLGRDLFLAYLGGEPCYEVKQHLESFFPGKYLLFIGYADSKAYVPNDKLNAEGGYEASGSTIEYGLKGTFKYIDRSIEQAFKSALSIT